MNTYARRKKLRESFFWASQYESGEGWGMTCCTPLAIEVDLGRADDAAVSCFRVFDVNV